MTVASQRHREECSWDCSPWSCLSWASLVGWDKASPGGFSPPFSDKAQQIDFSYLTADCTMSDVQGSPVLSVMAVDKVTSPVPRAPADCAQAWNSSWQLRTKLMLAGDGQGKEHLPTKNTFWISGFSFLSTIQHPVHKVYCILLVNLI